MLDAVRGTVIWQLVWCMASTCFGTVYVSPPQFDNVTCQMGLNELQQANPDGTGYCRAEETDPESFWTIPKLR